jgi:hypothetical protein
VPGRGAPTNARTTYPSFLSTTGLRRMALGGAIAGVKRRCYSCNDSRNRSVVFTCLAPPPRPILPPEGEVIEARRGPAVQIGSPASGTGPSGNFGRRAQSHEVVGDAGGQS